MKLKLILVLAVASLLIYGFKSEGEPFEGYDNEDESVSFDWGRFKAWVSFWAWSWAWHESVLHSKGWSISASSSVWAWGSISTSESLFEATWAILEQLKNDKGEHT